MAIPSAKRDAVLPTLPSDLHVTRRMSGQQLMRQSEESRELARRELEANGPTPLHAALVNGARALADLSQRSEKNG